MRLGVMDERSAREVVTSTPLPLGRAASCDRARWYFVHCPEGRERTLCRDLRRIVPARVMSDAFVCRSEHAVMDEGRWRTVVEPVFPGYFVAVTSSPSDLQRSILSHTLPLYVAGRMGNGYAPVAEEAQAFLSSVMDRHRVIRFSRATAGTRGLRVAAGPLVGCEARIAGVDAKEHVVRVRVCQTSSGTGDFSLAMPLHVEKGTEPAADAGSSAGKGMGVAGSRTVSSIPLSRRTPRGRLRWYLAECPAGREEELCRAVREAVPPAILQEAYVPKTEVVKKVRGAWTKPVVRVFSGRFAVATADVAALGARLGRLGLPVCLVRDAAGGYAPVDDEAWAFLESCMDGTRTIRESRGEIVGDRLHVWSGPLAGKESRVRNYVRHRSLAYVDMGEDAAGPHSITMPLAILARR